MNDPAEFVVFTFGARLRLRAEIGCWSCYCVSATSSRTASTWTDARGSAQNTYQVKSRKVTLTHCPYVKLCTIRNALPKTWMQAFAHNRTEGEMRAAHLNVRHFPQQRPIGRPKPGCYVSGRDILEAVSTQAPSVPSIWLVHVQSTMRNTSSQCFLCKGRCNFVRIGM